LGHKLKIKAEKIKSITLISFIITLGAIVVLIILPPGFWTPKKKEWKQSRTITPEADGNAEYSGLAPIERMAYADGIMPVISLNEGEIQIAVIAEDFDGDGAEEQMIAYRNLLVQDNPIYITYIDYDEISRSYKRIWSVPTGAMRPATVMLFSVDLIGDHRNCVVVTGMNQRDEQTFIAFKIAHVDEEKQKNPYKIIAQITMDGTIHIQETERSQAYQMGFAQGASFTIVDRGRDSYSANNFDQVEHIWAYDPVDGIYEKVSTVKIPDAQIEAKLVRDLLSGGKQEFEQFINGLWYHVNSEGTIDNDRYIYFDTANREVSFYNEDTQQVYGWQSSYATRYGLFISSQNISVTTLNRKIDIELESIDSIRVRVSEDVRMRIIMNAPWDGSYRKAKSLHSDQRTLTMLSTIDAEYNSPIGKIQFIDNGDYRIELNGVVNNGKYAFYKIGSNEFLEFVPVSGSSFLRQTYRVERNKNRLDEIALVRVRFGVNGLYEFREAPIILN
jgi:hypothetical protein